MAKKKVKHQGLEIGDEMKEVFNPTVTEESVEEAVVEKSEQANEVAELKCALCGKPTETKYMWVFRKWVPRQYKHIIGEPVCTDCKRDIETILTAEDMTPTVYRLTKVLEAIDKFVEAAEDRLYEHGCAICGKGSVVRAIKKVPNEYYEVLRPYVVSPFQCRELCYEDAKLAFTAGIITTSIADYKVWTAQKAQERIDSRCGTNGGNHEGGNVVPIKKVNQL